MNRTTAALFLILLAPVVIAGCVHLQNHQARQMPIEEKFRQQAMADEKAGRLQEALLAWRIVALSHPNDPVARGRIAALQQACEKTATSHYQKGLRLFQSGDYEGARKAFLTTLRLMPAHKRAVDYLKKGLYSIAQQHYTVQGGDSFSKIAARAYNDPQKADIIAHFNDLDLEKPLMIGQILILPKLDARHMGSSASIEAQLQRARECLEKQEFDEVLKLTAGIKSQAPDLAAVRDLEDRAYFQLGRKLLNSGNETAALEQFKKISAGYQGRDDAIRQVKDQIRKHNQEQKLTLADAQVRSGDYANAITMIAEILAQEPDHEQARSLFIQAHYALGKQLIERNEDLRAIEILSAIDMNYEDTSHLLAQARGRLNARAESFYRSGVKHFLNEDLDMAIQDWQNALELNPDHPKAAQDIDNARRLLKKWKGLE